MYSWEVEKLKGTNHLPPPPPPTAVANRRNSVIVFFDFLLALLYVFYLYYCDCSFSFVYFLDKNLETKMNL